MKALPGRVPVDILVILLWVALLAFFFAEVEIQAEGPHGWAGGMPTWRIEKHWLLDLFWGGRPLTGYHAWVFSFMFLVFHLPLAVFRRFSLALEARCLGSLMLFWIIEDFLWFVLNPAFGLPRLAPQYVPWHVHWFCRLPADYIVFSIAGAALILLSFRGNCPPETGPGGRAGGGR